MRYSIFLPLLLGVASAATIADEASGTQQIVLGTKLVKNPYTVENMKLAAASLQADDSLQVVSSAPSQNPLSGNRTAQLAVEQTQPKVLPTIRETHRYLKITPRTDADLNFLQDLDDRGIVIQDWPMDYEVVDDGDYYVHPSNETDIFHPVYTVVPVNIRLPPSLSVEVLDTLHEPDDSEEDIELAALEQANLDLSVPDARTLDPHKRRKLDLSTHKSRKLFFGRRYRPQGCVRVFNTDTGVFDPLRRTTIRIGRLVWWNYVVTNDNGCFVSPERYRGTVYIRIKWRSPVATIRKSWDEMLGFFVSNRLMTLTRNSNGRTYNIPVSDSRLWYKSTVHNGLVKYNDFAAHSGINRHVVNANVWVWENGRSSGAAPMLFQYRQLGTMASLAGFTQANFWQGLVNGLLGMLINLVPSRLRPDMIFSGLRPASGNPSTRSIDQLVFHESAHFSHARLAGSWFWAKLFSSELTNIVFQNSDPYGDGTQPSVEAGKRIGLTEGWATLCEYRAMDFHHNRAVNTLNVPVFLESFQMNTVPMTRANNRKDDGWFYHGLFWDVVDSTAGSAGLVNGVTGAWINAINDGVVISGGANGEFYPIFRFLTGSTHDACDFREKLIGGYPGQEQAIEDLFHSYGFDCIDSAPPTVSPSSPPSRPLSAMPTASPAAPLFAMPTVSPTAP